MSIDAWACQDSSAVFGAWQYEPKQLGSHDCEISISHCGICHSDLHLARSEWGANTYPFVPGHEIVGHVTAAGKSAEHLIGKRVGIGWQRSACLECETCQGGNENLCASSQATCVGHHGGFADRIRTDSRFVFELPDALDSAAAAPLMCGGITVFSPLRRAGIGKGSRVAVVGIGGLGHLGLQFAAAMGAHVTAMSSSADKAAESLKFGATEFVATSESGELRKHAGRFDFILSTVSASLSWDRYLEMLRPHGTLCFVGVPDAPLSLPVFSLIKGERSVSGSAIGPRARIQEMLEFSAQHGIAPQIELMPMSKVNEAMQRLADNKARYRIVLTT